jgi:hypothetical protein
MLAALGGGGLIGRTGIGGSGVRPLAAALAAAASELDPRPPWSPTAARRALTELHASVMVADGALDDDTHHQGGSGRGQQQGQQQHGGVGGGGASSAGGGGGGSAAAASASASAASSRAYDAGACRAWLGGAQAFLLAVQSLLNQCSAATATPDQALVFASAAGDLRRAAAALATAAAGPPAVATVSLAAAAAFAAKGQAGSGFGFGAPPGMMPRNVVSISCFGNGGGGVVSVLPPGGVGGGDGEGDWRRQQQQQQQPYALQQRSASDARLVAQRPVRPYEWYARKPAL